MRRFAKIACITAGILFFTVLGSFTGYYIAFNSESDASYGKGAVMAEAQPDIAIGENTVLEFVYNYSDGYSETQQSLPQQFMYGWNREQTAQAYSQWLMTEFGADRVVFTRSVEGNSPQHYVLKENKGYVAVYYRDSGILKEMTSTPVSALSDEDKKRFTEGVEIDGEKNLIKYLESLET